MALYCSAQKYFLCEKNIHPNNSSLNAESAFRTYSHICIGCEWFIGVPQHSNWDCTRLISSTGQDHFHSSIFLTIYRHSSPLCRQYQKEKKYPYRNAITHVVNIPWEWPKIWPGEGKVEADGRGGHDQKYFSGDDWLQKVDALGLHIFHGTSPLQKCDLNERIIV